MLFRQPGLAHGKILASAVVMLDDQRLEVAVHESSRSLDDVLVLFVEKHSLTITARELLELRSLLANQMRPGIFPKDEATAMAAYRSSSFVSEQHLAETHHRQYGNPWALGRDAFDWMLGHGLAPTWHVLDVGCGAMRLGVWLAAYLEGGHYIGADPDEASLEAAAQYEIPLHGLESKSPRLVRLSGSEYDALREEVEDESIDAVVLFSVVNHMSRDDAIDMFRALAPKLKLPEHRVWVSHVEPGYDILAEASSGGLQWLPTVAVEPGVHHKLSGSADVIPVWDLRVVPRVWIPATCGHDHRATNMSRLLRSGSGMRRQAVMPARLIVGCGGSGTSVVARAFNAHPSGIRVIWESSVAYNGKLASDVLEIFESLAANWSAYVEKTPSHVCELGGLLSAGGASARAIIVVRDGRDAVASMRATRPATSVASHAHRWVNDNLAGLLHNSDPRVTTVKYEQFVDNPRHQLERLAKHLDLDASIAAVDAMARASTLPDPPNTLFAIRRQQLQQPIHSQSIGKWRAELSPYDIIDFADAGGYGVLARLGYVLPSTPSSPQANVAYCIAGSARTLREARVLESIAALVAALGGGIDLATAHFFYALEIDSANETPMSGDYSYGALDLDAVFSALPPIRVAVVAQEPHAARCANKWTWCLAQFAKLKACYGMVASYEALRGFSYRFIVRLRPDVEYDVSPSTPSLASFGLDRVYAVRQGAHVCDMFAIVPRPLADIYFSVLDSCPPDQAACIGKHGIASAVSMPGCTCWLDAHLGHHQIAVESRLGLTYRAFRLAKETMRRDSKDTDWPPVWLDLPKFYHGVHADSAFFLFRHNGRTFNITAPRSYFESNSTAADVVRQACLEARVDERKCNVLHSKVLAHVVPSIRTVIS